MRPLVTALVDTYNHERYIEQTLASVLEQGLSPAELEIVVVDDGSTDKTPEIIRKFVPRVKHVRKKNGGQASAFNAGFAESHGEIVATLDGDDLWERGKLAKVANALEEHHEVAAVGHGYYEFREETAERRIHVPQRRTTISLASVEATRAAFVNWTFLLMGALTVRREVLERIMPLPEDMVFMADTALQCAAMAMGTLILDEPLFCYRHHKQNLYAIDPENVTKLERKYRMTELVYDRAYQILRKLQVPDPSISELLTASWLQARRARLRQFGGNPLHTFQAEMRSFRRECKDPSIRYRFFKYVIMGATTLVLPPQQFYKLRDWYARNDLGRYRDRLFKADVTASTSPGKPPERV